MPAHSARMFGGGVLGQMETLCPIPGGGDEVVVDQCTFASWGGGGVVGQMTYCIPGREQVVENSPGGGGI